MYIVVKIEFEVVADIKICSNCKMNSQLTITSYLIAYFKDFYCLDVIVFLFYFSRFTSTTLRCATVLINFEYSHND